ncbi:MAG: hypothetical protein M3083_13800 [Actinomycetota bacterium]|nr:hypothetical protein [Actinomycetota bacterium]MDQ6948797.1 hypothetical protein [Actinomycetota bacterium]
MAALEYSVTHWEGRQWDWTLFEGAERFLRERAIEGDDQANIELRLNDSQGGLGVATVTEGRERVAHEGTSPVSITLEMRSRSEGLAGTFSVASVPDHGRYRATMQFRSPRASDVRRCKAEFDQWLGRQEAASVAGAGPNRGSASIEAGRTETAIVKAEPVRSWWRPDLRNIRDNLISNLIWIILVAVVLGLGAYLGFR